ncbi:hypothetical protein AALO_G00279340 [Alosa alosa]|uniref:Uncharacterized protein n=1 Tax=Alosa alosa TaxID=278164 RepID=A0AAV6FNM0_9TELE|nr:hypothetical protein AALO_G00279340 [Alosa alosa]
MISVSFSCLRSGTPVYGSSPVLDSKLFIFPLDIYVEVLIKSSYRLKTCTGISKHHTVVQIQSICLAIPWLTGKCDLMNKMKK